LLALDLGLVEIGEVGVELEGQAEAGGLLGVVGEVQVLVHALADHAGNAQLQRLLRGRAHAALLAAFAALPRRAHDVVAHPVVLADVGHRRRIRALAPDPAAVQAEHAGLVHEQALLLARLDEAVALGREHGVAAADQQRVGAHLQARDAAGDVAERRAHAPPSPRSCGSTSAAKASMNASCPRLTLCSSNWSAPDSRSSRNHAAWRWRSEEMRTDPATSSARTNFAAASNCAGVRRSAATLPSKMLVRHCSSAPSRAAASSGAHDSLTCRRTGLPSPPPSRKAWMSSRSLSRGCVTVIRPSAQPPAQRAVSGLRAAANNGGGFSGRL